jgi:hypothetical protein
MPPSEHGDWVVDLGSGGGDERERHAGGMPPSAHHEGMFHMPKCANGGEIVVAGTPEQIAAEPRSFTGQYLRPLLERASVRPELVERRSAKQRRRKVVEGVAAE